MPFEKWTQQIMESNERNLNKYHHRYFLYSLNPEMENKVEKVKDESNVVWSLGEMSLGNYKDMIMEMQRADKIIFHSLFMSTLMMFIINLVGLIHVKKYTWFIWGGEIYNELWTFQKCKKNKKILVREWMRRWFIGRIPLINSVCDLDYPHVKKYYRTNAKFKRTFYQLPFLKCSEVIEKDDKETRILIGNNAMDTCQHIESMKKIKPFVDEKTKVYVILSYPKVSREYKKSVMRCGRDLFGDNFIPINKFVPYKEYMDFVNSIDIAVMNHNRQQGVSNLINLFHMGKKLYINPKNTYYHELKKYKGIVYNINEIDDSFLDKLSDEVKTYNKEIAEEMNSDKEYKKQWSAAIEFN